MKKVAAAAVVCGAMVSALVACQAIVGIHEYDPPPVDASPVITTVIEPAESGPAPAPVDECAHLLIPSGTTRGTSGSADLYFALDMFDFNSVSDAGINGFDLDDVCTGFDAGPRGYTRDNGGSTCVPRPGTSVASLADNADGIDNQLQGIVSEVESAIPDGRLTLTNTQIGHGLQTVLFRLTGWDGTAYAPSVSVSVVLSENLEVTDDCFHGSFHFPRLAPVGAADASAPVDAGELDAGDADAGDAAEMDAERYEVQPEPKGDGCDVWSISSQSLSGDGGIVLEISSSAYVINNVLYANFAELTLPFGGALISATGVTLVGTLVGVPTPDGGPLPYDNGVHLDGGPPQLLRLASAQIVGRLSTTTFLSALAYSSAVMNGPGVCPGNPYFDPLVEQVCSKADITADLNAGATAQCDALSFAAAVEATEIRAEGQIIQAAPHVPKPNCDGAPTYCPD